MIAHLLHLSAFIIAPIETRDYENLHENYFNILDEHMIRRTINLIFPALFFLFIFLLVSF